MTECAYLRAAKNSKLYRMTYLYTQYRRVIAFILSAVLFSGTFTSCNKGPVNVLYVSGIITENTAPNDIKDPEMHEAYVSLLGDFNNELADFMDSSASTFVGAGVSFKNAVSVELNPKDLRAEDERRIAVYDSQLLKLKQIESAYKERIEGLGKRDGTCFRIDVHYILMRGRENSDSVLLQEYQFELEYN